MQPRRRIQYLLSLTASLFAIAASNAALPGTIVVASAGNEGPVEGTVDSPAAGRHVIAVGVNNKTYTSAVLARDSGLQRDILKNYVAADVSYVELIQ